MPNWKKLVTSDSSPTFNHVTASGNISGSSTSTGSFGIVQSVEGLHIKPDTGTTVPFRISKTNYQGYNIYYIGVDGRTTYAGSEAADTWFALISNGSSTIAELHSDLSVKNQVKIAFDGDTINSYIAANDETPEDLEIHADQDILLKPDNNVGINNDAPPKTLTVEGSISSSGDYYGSRAFETGSIGGAGQHSGGDIVQHWPMHTYCDAGEVIVLYDGNEWRPADKDTEGYAIPMLGVALEDGDGSNFGQVLLRGIVRLKAGGIADSGTEGDPLYLSDDGTVKFAAPGSGDFARIVGYCIDEDDDIIYFNPDNTWVEVA